MGQLLAFVAVAGVVIVTPGQDTALTIRNTLLGGSRAGRRTAAGVAAGQTLWALAASLGLAALLAASEPVFLAIRLAGAAYLVWLGCRRCGQRWGGAPGGPAARGGIAVSPGPALEPRQREDGVFFTSLLPQFGGASFAALLGLGLLFSCLTLTWLSLYAGVVARAGDTLRRGPVRRALDALTGSVLVALGVKVAR